LASWDRLVAETGQAASSAPADTTTPDTMVALEHVIAGLDLDTQLTVTEQPGAPPRVTGYVTENAELRRLRREIRQAGLRATVVVRTGEAMTANGRAILTALKLPYRVDYQDPGRLVVRGDVTSPADRTALDQGLRTMRADIPGLLQLSDETTLAYRSPPDTRAAKPVSVEPKASVPVEPPRLLIRSISVGAVPFVVLEDGRRYFTGGQLDDGAVIRSIGGEQLVLEKDGQVFEHELTR